MGRSPEEDLAGKVGEMIVKMGESARTQDISEQNYAPARALAVIDQRIKRVRANIGRVKGYADKNQNQEHAKVIGYWLRQAVPSIAQHVQNIGRTINSYRAKNTLVSVISQEYGNPAIRDNPAVLKERLKNWSEIQDRGIPQKVKAGAKSGRYRVKTIQEIAAEPPQVQRGTGYASEWRQCMGRGFSDHEAHSEAPKQWQPNMTGHNESYERNSGITVVRNTLYGAQPKGGLELAEYHTISCAGDAINGTGKTGPAAIGPLVMSDSLILQAEMFYRLAKEIGPHLPIPMKEAMTSALTSIGNDLKVIGEYQAKALYTLPPVK